MSFFDNNLKYLKKNNKHVYDVVVNTSNELVIEAHMSKSGEMVPAIKINDKKIFVHSKFDPLKEAKRFIDEIETELYNLIIIFGFGFAYHIEYLLQIIDKNTNVLVIEKNSSIILNAIKERDLSRVLSDERFLLLIDPDEDSLSDILKGRSSSRVCFATHRGSYQVDPFYYGNIIRISRSYLSTKEVNIATLAKFEKIWSSNFARNIRRFIKNPGINIYFDKFNNIPAIIVAAGPSLTVSIEFIQKNKTNAIVIAVDTAIKVLHRYNIEPHFCVAVDPQVINARYFEGINSGNTVLITDPTVHPSVYRLFNGKVITSSVAFDILGWIENQVGVKGEISHGGSVSTNAYDFAKRIGASPIIMVGQDLGFTDGYAHARGSYLDEQIHIKTNRVTTPEMFNRKQIKALPVIQMKGVKDDIIKTNQKMMIFINWFSKNTRSDLINASASGVYIPGIKHLDLDCISFQSINKEISIVIDDIYSESINNVDLTLNLERIKKQLLMMIEEVESLIPVLERAVVVSEKLVKLIKEKRKDKNKLDYLMRKLAETDRFIESKENIKGLISLTVQRAIHTITEGYDIDINDSQLSQDELTAKRSLYLYKGILDGAIFSQKIFKKMIRILQ